jgi:hypothetical protein
MKKRYKVEASAKGYTYKFQIEVEENTEPQNLYILDNSSMIFQDVDGDVIVLPRFETSVEMKLLSPKWEENK